MFQKLSVLFTSQRHKERDCKLNLNLLRKSISCETTFKYLGVVFDNFMTRKAHTDYVCKMVVSSVSILGRVRSFVQKRQQHLFTMIQFSHYLITVTLPGVINLLQQDIDRLLRLKNRSAWIITHCSRSSEAIEQLHWLTLSSRHSYHKAKLIFLSSLISS